MIVNEELQAILDFLKDINFQDLVRAEELGNAYKFEEEANILKEVYEKLSILAEGSNLVQIPKDVEENINAIARDTKEKVERIQNFNLVENEQNARPEHNAIKGETEQINQNSLAHIQPLLERLELQKLNPTELRRQATEATTFLEEIKKTKEEVNKEKELIQSDAKEVRDTFGSEGASDSALHFGDQATSHDTLARKWLVASIVSIILVFGLITLLFTNILPIPTSDSKNLIEIVQYGLFRLTFLSLAYIVVSQSIKNYRVNQHLASLNRHRQLSLDVYKLMPKATKDPNHSNIILDHAARAIFNPSKTGYLGKDEDKNPIQLPGVISRIIDGKE